MNQEEAILMQQAQMLARPMNDVLSRLVNNPTMYSKNSYISGLRAAHIREALFDVADKSHVQFIVTDIDKDIIRETVYFTIKGTKPHIELFFKKVNQMVDEYNDQ